MSGKSLADRVSQFVHMWTLYGGYRPLGSAVIMAAHGDSGFTLHMVRPSGECYVNTFFKFLYFL